MTTTETPIDILDIIDGFVFVELTNTGEVVIAGADDPDTIEIAIQYAPRYDDFNDAYIAYCTGVAF